MKHFTSILITVLLTGLVSCNTSNERGGQPFDLNLAKLRAIGEVDNRYQSVNVEMCEVVGGDFWIPYELLDMVKVREVFFFRAAPSPQTVS